MRILCVGASTKHPGYQFRRLQEEGVKRGHEVVICRSEDLALHFDEHVCKAFLGNEPIETFDLIYPLAIARTSMLWRTLVRVLPRSVVMINEERLTRAHGSMPGEYLDACQAQIAIPRSVVSRSVETLCARLTDFTPPCVIKRTSSRRGREVAKVHTEAEIRAFCKQYIGQDGGAFVLREFIPNHGDLRVLVVDGEVLGALHRIPVEGEFRSNISQGATGVAFDLTTRPDISKLAQTIAALRGLDIAGVDVMIDSRDKKAWLLEVNSGPQIEGFETYTGVNVAEHLIAFFESRHTASLQTKE